MMRLFVHSGMSVFTEAGQNNFRQIKFQNERTVVIHNACGSLTFSNY